MYFQETMSRVGRRLPVFAVMFCLLAWSAGARRPPDPAFKALDGHPRKLSALRGQVVVVGVCMEQDTINPFFGISKELNIQFALAYDPMEFEQSLRSIAEGEIDPAPMITGTVGLDRVPWAFDALGRPEEHCKIMVTP